ncbi:hypothetical protein VKT23_001926 [Stygiomarasmius scandens]|uniref:Uncharacterized protein n=1 Tax=Marasmiellus scandens TaxID=2682957 RepID=A0ABR1K306_9AGAR
MPSRQNQFSHPMPPPIAHFQSSISSSSPELQSTLTTLQSLVAFYEDERAWIYSQRITADDPPALPIISPDIYIENLPSSSRLSSQAEIKEEPSDILIPNSSNAHFSRSESPETRWGKRKPDLKLKLHKLPPLLRTHSGSARRKIDARTYKEERDSSVDSLPDIETLVRAANKDAHLLDIFEEMMEARLKSCQRIDRLVRDARRKSVSAIPGLRNGILVPET